MCSPSAKVVLFLDTCHSGKFGENVALAYRGAVDNTEVIRELASEEVGVVVMSASTDRKKSQERPQWGHGAFTKALLEGLQRGRADIKRDGIIYLQELSYYIAESVKELTRGQQHTNTQAPSTISRFPVFQVRK